MPWGGENVGWIEKTLDKAIAFVSPEKGLRRAAARKTLNIMNSGYGNYGASTSKKSTVGWLYGGGSAREDIEDNLDVLRQRSRDLYMGVPLATGAVKTMRTNVVGRGLKLKPTIDREALGLAAEGCGAVLASEAVLDGDFLPPSLLPFTVGDPPVRWEVGFAIRAGVPLSAPAQLLVQAIQEAFGDGPAQAGTPSTPL